MVDNAVLVAWIAAVRDAVTRIRAVLPSDERAFADDRARREVVVPNLFVARQERVSLSPP